MPTTGGGKSPTSDPSAARRIPSRVAWTRGFLVLCTLGVGLLLAHHSLNDLDIWFHWRVGQDLLAGHSVPDRNQYSYIEPQNPWHDHEWLFQVLVGATGSLRKDLSPLPGLGAVETWNRLRNALALVLVWLLLAAVRRPDRPAETWGWAWGAVPVLAGLAMLWPRLVLRPELISYIALCMVVPAAETAVWGRGEPTAGKWGWQALIDPRRPLGQVVWLTLIWAQFHGFAALGPLVLGIAALTAPIQRRLYGIRTAPAPGAGSGSRIGAGLLLAVAALAATPGGWRGLVYPLRALSQFREPGLDLRGTISELTPLLGSPNVLDLTIRVYLGSLVWGAVWCAVTWPRTSLLRILLWGGAAAAAWSNQRSIGICAVAFVLLHQGRGGIRPALFSKRGLGWPGRRLGVGSGLLVTAAIAACWAPWIVGDGFYLHEGVARRFGGGTTPAQLPQAAAADLAGRGQVRVFGNIDAAGFLLGTTSCRVFIDGRTEAYSPSAWSTYARIKAGDEQAPLVLGQQRPQAVCLTLGTGAFSGLARRLLADPGWSLQAADAGGLLFFPADTSAGPAPGSMPGSAPGFAAALAAAGQQVLLGPAGLVGGSRRADWCQGAANLFQLAGDTKSQEDALRAGLAARSDHPTLLHNLGNVVMERGQYAEAAGLFEAALRANPRLAGSALNAGFCRIRMQQPAQALPWFERAVRIDRGNYQAWANLGGAQAALGRRAEAIRSLERAVALRPQEQALRRRLEELRRQASS